MSADSDVVKTGRYELEAIYECPVCDHTWRERWPQEFFCDSTCPACGTGDITATSVEEVLEEG